MLTLLLAPPLRCDDSSNCIYADIVDVGIIRVVRRAIELVRSTSCYDLVIVDRVWLGRRRPGPDKYTAMKSVLFHQSRAVWSCFVFLWCGCYEARAVFSSTQVRRWGLTTDSYPLLFDWLLERVCRRHLLERKRHRSRRDEVAAFVPPKHGSATFHPQGAFAPFPACPVLLSSRHFVATCRQPRVRPRIICSTTTRVRRSIS